MTDIQKWKWEHTEIKIILTFAPYYSHFYWFFTFIWQKILPSSKFTQLCL